MLLSENADPSVVIANLTDLIRELEAVPSLAAGRDGWFDAQKGYLQVVEKSERVLGSLFEDDEGGLRRGHRRQA